MKRISRRAFFDEMAKRVLSKPVGDRCSSGCRYRAGCEQEKPTRYCPQKEWRRNNITKVERQVNKIIRGL